MSPLVPGSMSSPAQGAFALLSAVPTSCHVPSPSTSISLPPSAVSLSYNAQSPQEMSSRQAHVHGFLRSHAAASSPAASSRGDRGFLFVGNTKSSSNLEESCVLGQVPLPDWSLTPKGFDWRKAPVWVFIH